MTMTSPGSVRPELLFAPEPTPAPPLRLLAGLSAGSSADRSISAVPTSLFRFGARVAAALLDRAGASSSESSIVIVSAVRDARVDAAGRDGRGGNAAAEDEEEGAGLAVALSLPLPLSITGGGRAYRSVQRLASRSCCKRLRTYSVAICGTERVKVSKGRSRDMAWGHTQRIPCESTNKPCEYAEEHGRGGYTHLD